MRGRTKWLILVALALFALIAVSVSAEGGEEGGKKGRVSFKMNNFDDDDDDEIADAPAAEEQAEEEVKPYDSVSEKENGADEQTKKPEKKKLTRRKHSHAMDDDEFEGTDEVKAQQVKENKYVGPQKVSVDSLKKQQDEAQAALRNAAKAEKTKPRDWIMEICFCSFIGFYLVWFLIGMIANTRKARNWLNSMRGFLDEQFAQIGDPVRNIKDLERESFSQFYLQASGRINCIGARFLVDLRHRQDFMTDVFGLFLGKRDQLALDVMLPNTTPLVFALMKNSEKKKMTEDNRDLSSSSVSAVPNSRLNSVKVTVLTDNPAVTDVLVDDNEAHGKLLSVIESNADLFVSLHVTDRSSVYQTNRSVLRSVVRLPSSEADQARLLELLRSIMAFSDNVATLKMSKAAQARATSVRQAEKKEKERRAAEEKREAMEKAREEKKEKEYMNMTPEQRAKLEEKQRRRQEKKQKIRYVTM